MSIQLVVSKQNRDGGWPYVQGSSRTEPTAYAILALLAAGELDAARRGVAWLHAAQLPDGGWPPQLGFDESTWVTALVALIPVEQLGEASHAGAIHWLLDTTGEESTVLYRARVWLLGGKPFPEHEFPGWPWIPGAAAWVGPTSLALLALDKELARKPSAELKRRIEEGRHFLLRRVCLGGGWNHGSVRALGYESTPYPETTGMGLAALRGVRAREIDLSLSVAERFLAECRSADALNWLRIGLMAHGRLPGGWCPPHQPPCRTLLETSLDLVVSGTRQPGDFFWV
ncbi:MAG: prenyltransferase/squalene oxidase repeat-containing protein [Candidatus Solibacter sp.]